MIWWLLYKQLRKSCDIDEEWYNVAEAVKKAVGKATGRRKEEMQ